GAQCPRARVVVRLDAYPVVGRQRDRHIPQPATAPPRPPTLLADHDPEVMISFKGRIAARRIPLRVQDCMSKRIVLVPEASSCVGSTSGLRLRRPDVPSPISAVAPTAGRVPDPDTPGGHWKESPMRVRRILALLAVALTGALIAPSAAQAMTPKDVNPDNSVQIIGGNTVSSAPWAVAVFRDGSFTCSGSIIASRWVLT